MYKTIKASIKPLIQDKELYKKVKAEIKKIVAQEEPKGAIKFINSNGKKEIYEIFDCVDTAEQVLRGYESRGKEDFKGFWVEPLDENDEAFKKYVAEHPNWEKEIEAKVLAALPVDNTKIYEYTKMLDGLLSKASELPMKPFAINELAQTLTNSLGFLEKPQAGLVKQIGGLLEKFKEGFTDKNADKIMTHIAKAQSEIAAYNDKHNELIKAIEKAVTYLDGAKVKASNSKARLSELAKTLEKLQDEAY